ncbi:MAG: metal-dependent transcriptional regulator [Coriobacteriia bacterium]|nr:metal-dependent transcriptional regulator [Coriobacteriia bacterium]
MYTPNVEEYLEAILRLSCVDTCVDTAQCQGIGTMVPSMQRGECIVAHPSDIAEMVGVTRPSVSTALARMGADWLVTRQGKGVILTPKGFDYAREILRRHRVAERFLVEVLGFERGTVHEEACVLEHALSNRIVAGLQRLVDDAEKL